MPEMFYGGEVIEYEFDHIPACMSEQEYKAWKEEQKMLRKGQRSLFTEKQKEEREKARLEALGIKVPTHEDLINDLPF